jgi:4-amino-4-deoxy-L-arabinose transferase-like glycosyltransferase
MAMPRPVRVRAEWILLAATVVAAFALWRLAREDSFTVDEAPHLAAGYTYWHYQTGRLNPEHPPLLKLLSAAFVRGVDVPRALVERPDETPQVLQYEAGRALLAGDYGRSRRTIRRSRMAPIVLTLLLVWVTFGFGRWLFHAEAGLVAALFLLASPLVLAHGHYVTTDVGAALGCVAATWAYFALLRRPSWWALALAALGFGLAQLMKFSALILIPFFVLVSLWRRDRLWRLPALIVLAYAAVVAPCYYYVNRHYAAELQRQDLAEVRGNLAVATRWLAQNEATRPLAQYALGVALAQRRVSEASLFYFQGVNSATGTAWYFPLTYLWKEPLPAILFAATGLVLGGRQLLLVFVAIYGAASLLTPLNIGARHLLPLYPFVFLCAAQGWVRARAVWPAGMLLVWCLVEVTAGYPNLLSYCNPIGGGTAECYQKLTDSNYDWGQDLERLRQWAAARPEAVIAVDYFGGDNAASALGGRVIGWWSARGNPRAAGARYFAVSVHQLQACIQPATYPRKAEDEYGWLTQWRGCGVPGCQGAGRLPPPDFRAGTSIFIYDLER